MLGVKVDHRRGLWDPRAYRLLLLLALGNHNMVVGMSPSISVSLSGVLA